MVEVACLLDIAVVRSVLKTGKKSQEIGKERSTGKMIRGVRLIEVVNVGNC
jgi:hypothetical protein